MKRIENAGEIDDIKRKGKGELTEEEHERLRSLEASRGPTENTKRGVQETGPRSSSWKPREQRKH